jgi:hypothetical protein
MYGYKNDVPSDNADSKCNVTVGWMVGIKIVERASEGEGK